MRPKSPNYYQKNIMVKRILLSIVLLLVIAYLVVAVTAFNRKSASQVCQDAVSYTHLTLPTTSRV